MTNTEFSNTFDTLLNSYNIQARFGEQASKMDITLDEYEKSVLLTQAQDIIVKTFFDPRLNSQGAGFDDNEKRQVDFSSLIQVKTLNRVATLSQNACIVDPRNGSLGIIKFNLKRPDILPDLNVELNLEFGSGVEATEVVESGVTKKIVVTIGIDNISNPDIETVKNLWDAAHLDDGDNTPVNEYVGLEIISTTGNVFSYTQDELRALMAVSLSNVTLQKVSESATFDDRGILYNLPSDLLFMLNEKLEVTNGSIKKKYVVIPINYREYDRENSKPYSQPYKKQCWRLFQNVQGFDILSEIIPVWDAINDTSVVEYKVRYVRRPQPIVLVNLPDDLEIDGKREITQCEVSEVLHMEILNKAVELALTFKGGRQVQSNQQE